ncbi:mitoferrin-1-related [Anaeramoeba flamelloides]|uniref:Mitoferrin-1-related n=1 Tax=Anaeramoeba flamelloides TaxID=1746091 RepID=A0AAV7Z084_9EUKA|nr:mitoferrin-1-related [Anaeramoeba flamelloides]|eukprot:Anaeramoba_flamelloidesc39335_g2_i1.p1 GENE.c39335_g2_i1~~c39335_g2_i1.p1  ORF type:complete len:254 (+),score=46.35 c39335_g2_i1:31-762(+)
MHTLLKNYAKGFVGGAIVGVGSEIVGLGTETVLGLETPQHALQRLQQSKNQVGLANGFIFANVPLIKKGILLGANWDSTKEKDALKIGIFTGVGLCLLQNAIFTPVNNHKKYKEETGEYIFKQGFGKAYEGYKTNVISTLPFFTTFLGTSELLTSRYNSCVAPYVKNPLHSYLSIAAIGATSAAAAVTNKIVFNTIWDKVKLDKKIDGKKTLKTAVKTTFAVSVRAAAKKVIGKNVFGLLAKF